MTDYTNELTAAITETIRQSAPDMRGDIIDRLRAGLRGGATDAHWVIGEDDDYMLAEHTTGELLAMLDDAIQATAPIGAIRSRREAQAEANRRWEAGTNAGDGDEWDAPEGATEIVTAETDREVSVYRMPDGSEVAVGDLHGPWAVDITPPPIR